MGDALEIIAKHLCDRAGQGWSGVSTFERAAYRTAAHGMIATLTAAGYRIIGPDELDDVTMEKAAALCLSASVEATNPSRACQADELGEAIRSLKGGRS